MKSFCLSSLFLLLFQFLPIQSCAAKSNRFSVDKEGIQTIASKTLRVSVDSDFPRITQYNWVANGAVFYGQEDQLSQVMINGKLYTPKTSFSLLKDEGGRQEWNLNVAATPIRKPSWITTGMGERTR